MGGKSVDREWWDNLSEDEQIWTMMIFGFEKFNPRTVTSEQIQKMYNDEHG